METRNGMFAVRGSILDLVPLNWYLATHLGSSEAPQEKVWLTDNSSDGLLTHISDVRDRLKRVNERMKT